MMSIFNLVNNRINFISTDIVIVMNFIIILLFTKKMHHIVALNRTIDVEKQWLLWFGFHYPLLTYLPTTSNFHHSVTHVVKWY